ncbi:hypothetical protein BGX24_003860, partial [Mortierella sp. AD032]
MGIPYLWPFVRKKGYEAPLLSRFPQDPLPTNAFYRVDILASFFSVIRRAYVNHDLSTANTMVAQHLVSCGLPQASTVLYVDGQSPEEKRRTREFRDRKRADALAKAVASISDMENIFRSGGRLRKPHFKKLTKHLNASFVWSMASRRALAQHLQGLGWSVVECDSEADIAIASDCGAHDVAVSRDSDSLVYSSIVTILRPLGRGRYLMYDVPKLLKHLEISRTALTVLGIVCRNDYSSNMSRLGVSTNFKIILSLEKDVTFVHPSTMIGAYLAHKDVACKYPGQNQFDAPLKIFVRLEFSINPTPSPQEVNHNSAQEITQRLRDLRLNLESNK